MIARKVPPVNLLVVGDYGLRKRVVTAHNNMTSVLPFDNESNFAKSLHHFLAGHLGQVAHTATNNVSKVSSGIGKPSSFNASS